MILNNHSVAATTIDRESLFKRLYCREQVLLTASNRQARYWSQQYHGWAEGQSKVWSKPNIMPLNTWLNQLYQTIALVHQVPRKLNRADSLRHWQTIIEKNIGATQLISEQTTARKAYDAFQFYHLYKIPLEKPSFADLDLEYFHAWRETYEDLCRSKNWLDESQLYNWLVNNISNDVHFNEYLPSNIGLLGFSELEPARVELFEHLVQTFSVTCEVLSGIDDNLARNDGTLKTETKENERDNAKLVTCDDPQQEIYQAATWALQMLQQEPTKRIAILVPELEQKRSTISQWLNQVFHPEALSEPVLSRPIYNISVGQPLSHLSGCRVAQTLIKWLCQPITAEAFSELINTPCLSSVERYLSSEQLFQLKQWTFTLPSQSKTSFSFEQWIEQILVIVRKQGDIPVNHSVEKNQYHDEKLANLTEWVSELRTIKQQSEQSGSLVKWSSLFKQWLMLWGWYDSTYLSSYQYQLRSSVFELIKSLRSQVIADKKISSQSASKLFSELFSNASFQAKSQGEPIQIMGLLEAVSLEYDAIWITGLTNQLYPATPQPNPFISPPVAKHYGVPGSGPERELQFSQELFAKLKQVSNHRVVSYPKLDDDREMGVSPLVHILVGNTESEKQLAPNTIDPLKGILDVTEETYDDYQGVPYPRAQLSQAIAFFQAQAECPTKAYLAYRVNLTEQESIEEGINPLDRGTFVHRVLQVLWQKLQNQQTLLALSDEEENELIEQALKACDDRFLSRHELLTNIEYKRYASLIKELLLLEKQRPAFRVLDTEKEETINFAGLMFTARLDRIDELEQSGAIAIIDYKTGMVSSNKWFDERITEPQLPLYSLNAKKPIGALAFASLHPKEVKFDGVIDEHHSFLKLAQVSKKTKGQLNDWSAFMEHVKNDLSVIAEEIKQGYAALTPKNKQACEYCEFASICRINEFKTVDDEDSMSAEFGL